MSSVFILKPVDLSRAKCFCFELFWREARGVCGKARVQPLVIAACLFVCFVCLCFDSVDDSCVL